MERVKFVLKGGRDEVKLAGKKTKGKDDVFIAIEKLGFLSFMKIEMNKKYVCGGYSNFPMIFFTSLLNHPKGWLKYG